MISATACTQSASLLRVPSQDKNLSQNVDYFDYFLTEGESIVHTLCSVCVSPICYYSIHTYVPQGRTWWDVGSSPRPTKFIMALANASRHILLSSKVFIEELMLRNKCTMNVHTFISKSIVMWHSPMGPSPRTSMSIGPVDYPILARIVLLSQTSQVIHAVVQPTQNVSIFHLANACHCVCAERMSACSAPK